jgi:hypothetical protein
MTTREEEMDGTYLHRLSRPRRDDESAPRPTDEAGRRLAVVLSPPEPESGGRAARLRRVAACEICGRTLLAGERAREIVVGERVAAACPLCVIGAQHAARLHAA